ncbi:MAG: hypothetical protein IMY72_09015 [Bacteroidetes bacterium]|nr:hypothetical protein [Bacteroidota bacterium]
MKNKELSISLINMMKLSIEEDLKNKISSIKNFSIYSGVLGNILFLNLYNEYFKIRSEVNEEVINFLFNIQNLSIFQKKGAFPHWFWLANKFSYSKVSQFGFNERVILRTRLLEASLFYFKQKKFDLFKGGIGLLISALSLKNDFSKEEIEYLTLITNAIKNTSEIDKFGGLKWKTQNATEKNRFYNLGLAHGITSIIAVCLKIFQIDNINSQIKNNCSYIIQNAFKFLEAQKLDEEEYFSKYPDFAFVDKQKRYSSRLAWCYGDLSIGYTLLRAGKILHNDKITNSALDTLRKTVLRRNYKQNNILDPGFCHGISGVAYIYKKIYMLTNESIYEEANSCWINDLFECLNIGVNSFFLDIKKITKNREFYNNYKLDNSFLMGYSGIGIVLLSHLTDILSDWDDIVLLS